jgi:hypothetical protein
MATIVGKYIAENLKKKGIDQLKQLKDNYAKNIDQQNDNQINIIKKKKNFIEEEQKNVNNAILQHTKTKDRLSRIGSISIFLWNNFTGFFKSLWKGILILAGSKGVILQYILLIIVFIIIIVAIYGGFGGSTSSKSVLPNESNKNSPSDIINANNIYKEDKSFISNIIPKSMYYYLSGVNNSFNQIFYNKDYILSKSIDRTIDKTGDIYNGRYDDMITVPKYNNRKFYIQTYLVPKNIEWKFPENSYINSDFNNLPDYIKNYISTYNTISLNNKKIMVFPFEEEQITGIYKLQYPYYKYNNSKIPLTFINNKIEDTTKNTTSFDIVDTSI